MKNLIAFERGRNPKESLGIGVESMKKKHRIMVIESLFKDLETARDSLFGSDQYGKYPHIGTISQIQDAYFVIMANDDKFRIVKMRFGPMVNYKIRTDFDGYLENWDYPKEKINHCIMWLAAEAEKLEPKDDRI